MLLEKYIWTEVSESITASIYNHLICYPAVDNSVSVNVFNLCLTSICHAIDDVVERSVYGIIEQWTYGTIMEYNEHDT